jgi:TatD DNase family protein
MFLKPAGEEQLMLVDSHAHLIDEKFDRDREELIARTRAGGVALVINAGYDLDSSRRSAALAEKNDFVFAAVGIHPHDAAKVSGDYLDVLKELAAGDKVVAIGETGLDYYRNLSPPVTQQRVFREQLALARKLDLPVVVHDRQSNGELLKILLNDGVGSAGGVMHCFSGSWEMARECIQMGLYISIAGVVTYPGSVSLKNLAARLPLECLLVETDCPYLTPVPYRGKRNEPLYVRLVVEEIARLRGMPAVELAQAVLQNTRQLFQL